MADGLQKKRCSAAFLLPIIGICYHFFRLNHSVLKTSFSLNRSLLIPWPGHPPVKVFSPSKYNATVAMCLIVRNETVYMDEWVDFHVALGFAPIWIYDNADVPDLELQSWYERRRDIQQYIHIVHLPHYPVQVAAYERCLQNDTANATYAAMLDIDEFVVLKKHDNIVDLMVDLCDEECGQLSLNWNPMGTSNASHYSPIPVTKRNVHIHTSEPYHRAMFKVVKAIVRPSYVSYPMDWSHTVLLKRGHWVDTNGTRLKRMHSTNKCCIPYEHPTGPTDVGVIYHYKYRSEEEYYYKSCVRGDSLLQRGDMTKCGHRNKYGNFPRDGTDYDDGAWKQLKRHIPKYAIFDRLDNVSLY